MTVDTLWVLLAATLVFFMNLGFAAVESGFARSKNTVNIPSKNFIVFAVSSLGFLLLGWGLMFGGDAPFVGTQSLFILDKGNLDFYKDTLTPNVPFWAKFFFQLVFCGTAATIVSGAVAERIKYISFILFSFVLTLVIYPIIGHWVWGGGWLAGLVAITGGCAYVSVASSLIIGAIAGVLVVISVLLFDRAGIDDPVGAISVHIVCGVFGTICVALFAREGITSLSGVNGLFFGGGISLLGIQLLGIIAVGVFTFALTSLVWFLLKKTVGIRVSLEEEIQGLDIGEHGNSAYPDFAILASILDTSSENGYKATATIPVPEPVNLQAAAPGAVPPDVAVPIVNKARPGVKMTKVTIITSQEKLAGLQDSLDKIGITGLTVTNVLGYGMQKGHTEYYRGAPVKIRLLPKVQVDIVVCRIPTQTVVDTVKKALYTGNMGDGKIFIYDVENVIKIRTGEEVYDALQDEEDE
jgi:ammonia channel protein AmtB/nitrogen regulatory protein PII